MDQLALKYESCRKGVCEFWPGRISGQLQGEYKLSLRRNCCQCSVLLFWPLKTHKWSGENACTAFISCSALDLGKRMPFPKHLLLSMERNTTFLAISQDFPNFILKLVFPMIRKYINKTILQARNRQKYWERGSFNQLFQSSISNQFFQKIIYKVHASTWLLVTWVVFAERIKTPIIMKLWDIEEEWGIGKSAEVETAADSTKYSRGLVTFYLCLGIFTSFLPAKPVIRQQIILKHHCPMCSVHTVIKIICIHRLAFQFTHQLLDKPQHWK